MPLLHLQLNRGPGWGYWINGEMGRDAAGDAIFAGTAEKAAQKALAALREQLPDLVKLIAPETP